MKSILGRSRSTPPWDSLAPVREELFGIERLEQHAQSLALAQQVTDRPPSVLPLHVRLSDNAAVLLAAYRASAAELEHGHEVVPAAEWLLDNYHIVEEQIREVRDDLPPGYYRQLPKLAAGPFAGYPRVLGVAWAFVAHTDSHVDLDQLRVFISAYQHVQPLTIGELWAVAITLRIVLLENLRRLAEQIGSGRAARAEADVLADRLLVPGQARSALEADIAQRAPGPLSELLAAQLAKRLRDQDPRTTPALGWLEERLKAQGVAIDEVVQHAQQRQGASNVTVRNVITSMRLISAVDWAKWFESVSLVDARLRAGSAFASMDFPTRNLYRTAIEQLARGSALSELQVVDRVLEATHGAAGSTPSDIDVLRVSDPGYHLIAEGRPALERVIAFRAPLRLSLSRFNVRLGIGGYIGAILLLGAVLLASVYLALARPALPWGWMLAFLLCLSVPITEVATALINRLVTWSTGAITLPALELLDGVPTELRTLVAVPTLLSSEADLQEQVERLEVHHLAGIGGDLAFVLLLDGADAPQEVMGSDAPLLALAAEAIERLNQRYGPGPGGQRFFLLYRQRRFNAAEGCWMGWERKRGKLQELNRLLRGASDTSFVAVAGQPPRVPADVRLVITLDADTRLPREAALRLIGKMAHPLNRPHFDPLRQRVVNGHAVLQPRVTPSLPMGCEGSLYLRIFSGPAGMDPYAAAVSDVYQDLFGEGSFTGKGIYDVDAFEAALDGRVADNCLLSHDLFEGIFARAGLASDVEVVEESPSRFDVATKRTHRWTRGDWQLLPWMLGHWAGPRAVPLVGRCKMLDNLRRSLIAPFTLASLLLCWWLPLPLALLASVLVLATLAIPPVLPILCALPPPQRSIRLRSHFAMLGGDFCRAALQVLMSVAFLANQAWSMGDAILRTLWRLYVSHRHLLEWTTAAQSSSRPLPGWLGSYRLMAGGTALALLAGVAGLLLAPANWPLILPLTLLWLGAPVIALRSSRPARPARRLELSAADVDALRLTARRTWRFFETFVTPADNLLPPDNFQEQPKPQLAHRTSPTNIGLYMLSAVAARDFGWAGGGETLERLEGTLAVLEKLPRSHGHFYNWYGTRDLRPLEPMYLSSVDSGNLAGHLIVLANACEQWRDNPRVEAARQGLLDDLQLALEIIDGPDLVGGEALRKLKAELEEIHVALSGPQVLDALLPSLGRLAEKAARAAASLVPADDQGTAGDLLFWIEALRKALAEHHRDRQPGQAQCLAQRLQTVADTARRLALEMDFGFLLNQERKLLSIGYSLADNRLDPSCYDLLASEARLASLFAIAKGDLPTRHWFRLGRTATPVAGGSALISWSGSMFEYLMPSLVMRAPAGSLLEQSTRLAVARQEAYGTALGIPWGISESAYNARDLEFTYQYSNFGVPGLGLKRGLAENVVIAPYATALATMVDPQAAQRNFDRLAQLGALGRYGFYEALDFTRSRLQEDERMAIVYSFMAHHQGMSIVAIANTLQGGRMRCRLHREPMIQASELLLQERVPRDVALGHPRAEEVKVAASEGAEEASTLRRIDATRGGPPITHLLSNGRYALMLTASGGGYSRWGDIAVTRWREDATCDDWGSFIFLRDMQSGQAWSPTLQPSGQPVENGEVLFDEDHAEFIQRDAALATSLEVLVSGEDDGEVRRVSLTNHGRRAREIELTSYAEVVLATPAADSAHPVFSRMFVQTEYLAEFGALVATRRPRSPDETPVWAAHFTVVEGEVIAAPQYESDRARLLGRGRSLREAHALVAHQPLENSQGSVLDPIFSLRQRVRVAPGKVARVAFWTLVASSREALLDLIDQHHERNAFERAKTLAWTQAQVQLRDLGIDPEEAADFQRLAAPILYADARFRAPPEAIRRGAGRQSGLWPLAISGDLPIVLLRIDEVEDLVLVRQLLRACEYWRMKGLDVDLVIVNERSSSYVQDLQVAIETSVRSCQVRPHGPGQSPCGGVHTLRADLMTLEARELLHAVARVSLLARHGSIAAQLGRLLQGPRRPLPNRHAQALAPLWPAPATESGEGLEFFNGLGGFEPGGAQYRISLEGERNTPAPWINVIANPQFGFQVSAQGSGYTWAGNSRDNQLSPWSNDPVVDPPGEAFYIRDEDSRALWSPTAQPIRDSGVYRCTHGFGYSRFSHAAHGIETELLQYVPLDDPLKISRLTLRNASGRARRLSVTAYVEWVLGTSRGASAPFIQTEVDADSGALLARNPWSIAFAEPVAFADLGGRQSTWSADRREFLGYTGSVAAPQALSAGTPLSGACGAGLDPCAALQCVVELAAGESVEVLALLGQAVSADAARELVERYRTADLDALLARVKQHWDTLLGAVQVRTPDRAMDLLLNGWLLYQTLACRICARSAFYQSSGAYGFRDQLQDCLALSFACPAETRRHLLRVAGRQFVEGDVQHWWLPQTGQGVRTRISDDRVWLAYACASYIESSADVGVLDEIVAFIEGPQLHPGESDAFFQPLPAEASASLFEHCARGLDQSLELSGVHGLPLIGSGDWNDGMNRVGAGGQGESVWLGWLLLHTLERFAPLADGRDDTRAAHWRARAEALRQALERSAWDGQWYRRATFDDGSWLGSAASEECRIDAIAQSWSVLSGGAEPVRAAIAMDSLEHWLIRREEGGLALLFTPPFEHTPHDPGYIKGYPPGMRENGGQYSHAAMWSILALTRLGEGDKAAALFSLLNPVNHARTPEEVQRYKVEPYVIAADVYSVAPHVGRGGWTWYTGSAGWMYRAGVEGILGLRRAGADLLIDPCIPRDWPGFEVSLRLGESRYEIVLVSAGQRCRGLQWALLDDAPLACDEGTVSVRLQAGEHRLQLFL